MHPSSCAGAMAKLVWLVLVELLLLLEVLDRLVELVEVEVSVQEVVLKVLVLLDLSVRMDRDKKR